MYSTELEAFPTKAGSDLFYGISAVASSAYDPNTMDFAPIKCVFEDVESDQSYQMFILGAGKPSEENSCDNQAIQLNVSTGTRADNSAEWRFQHILFLFSGKGGNYNLKCDVVVCDKNSSEVTECQNARTVCNVDGEN